MKQSPGRVTAPRILWPALIAAAVCAAYANSFAGAFLFDDMHHVVENERIRRLRPIEPLLSVERPAVEVSLAINYAIGELNPVGYHLFNLGVHVLAALTLFGVTRRTLASSVFHEAVRANAAMLAWAIATIWAAHPLTTQNVTYIIQRGESMMGLFYLLTLYCAIRAREGHRRVPWAFGAVAACALGMASKAVMVTCPLIVVIYDFVFPPQRDAGAVLPGRTGRWAGRAWLYAGLAATWAVLWLCGVFGQVLGTASGRANVGFGYREVTPIQYLLTQPGVVLWYLRLALWPNELCLDYDWPIVATWRDGLMPALPIAALLLGTVWAVVRRRPIGFAGAWFFLILAPTSSIVPIEDAAFEHRMYLPLAAVAAVLVVCGFRSLQVVGKASARQPIFVLAACVAIIALGWTTFRRNAVYASDLSMWGDVVAKRPHNARAHVALGNALLARDRIDDALVAFRRAVELRPTLADAHITLAMALTRIGAMDEAAREYREGLRLEPAHAKGWYNLGNALGRQGKVDEAIAAYQRAIELRPRFADAHCNLGNALGRRGRLDEAVAEYRFALDIDPQLAKAHNNLGDALRQQGKLEEATAAFHRAIAADPGYTNAYVNLAAAYLDRGDPDRAAQNAREALRLDPTHTAAKDILSQALARKRN